MIKEIVLFAGAFAVATALGSAATGCYSSACSCPLTPNLPPAQNKTYVASFETGNDGPDAAPVIRPQNGTFQVTGSTIVIRYEDSGVTHEVVYAVEGSL